MGFWDILLNENIYISALSSLENPGRYSWYQSSSWAGSVDNPHVHFAKIDRHSL